MVYCKVILNIGRILGASLYACLAVSWGSHAKSGGVRQAIIQPSCAIRELFLGKPLGKLCEMPGESKANAQGIMGRMPWEAFGESITSRNVSLYKQ